MESDDADQHDEPNESVLSNHFSDGNLKLNVKVRVKYNKPPAVEDGGMPDPHNASESTANETAASTRSLYGENVSNQTIVRSSTTDFQPSTSRLPSAMDDSPFLRSFNSNLSKSLSSTPIKKPSAHAVDKAVQSDEDDLKCIAYPEQVDVPSNDSFDFSSVSSNDSSLLSINSTVSRNSQSTEQLYDYEDPLSSSRKSPVVQACVRVRPMNRFESNNKSIRSIVEVDELNSTLNLKGKNEDKTRFKFKFNQLFYSRYNRTPEENQEEVYTRIGQPHLSSLLEGNDLCFIAYGQTGSGKSYTIMGDEQAPGLVFRFARQLFEIASLNQRTDLEQLFSRLATIEDRSTAADQRSKANDLNNNSTLLAAKKRLSEAAQKYGFTDVINGYSPNNSFDSTRDERPQSSPEKIGREKVLRFDENIKCYTDDYVYHEKLLASESEEFSSMDSFKNLELRCEQQYSDGLTAGERQNLHILNNVLNRFAGRRDSLRLEFDFQISFYEIYNEAIYDLLEPSEERIKSKVRYHPTSGPYIVDLTTREIESLGELERYYELGTKRRSKGSTSSNEQSSRSHAVLTIYVGQTHHYQSTLASTTKTSKLHSKITFVDLAGSERTSTNEPTNDERLREGNSINKSLLTLGKVINRLARINKWIKEKGLQFDEVKNSSNPMLYVPYRDSTLTWLLRDCFNGKCKTFMIATIAPSSNHYDPTLSTLRYANKASKIRVSFRFNQLPAKPSNGEQSAASNGKQRLFIEQVEHLRTKKETADSESDRSGDRSSSVDRSSNADRSSDRNDQTRKDAAGKSETEKPVSSESTRRPDIVEALRTPAYKFYESHLIEKITELFKDFLQ